MQKTTQLLMLTLSHRKRIVFVASAVIRMDVNRAGIRKICNFPFAQRKAARRQCQNTNDNNDARVCATQYLQNTNGAVYANLMDTQITSV